MTKEEFKQQWEQDDRWFTLDELIKISKEWRILKNPHAMSIGDILYEVLRSAQVSNARFYKPTF